MWKKKEIVDAVELLAIDLGGGSQVEHMLRLMGGSWPSSSPLPTRPGHMALCNLGKVFTHRLINLDLIDILVIADSRHLWVCVGPKVPDSNQGLPIPCFLSRRHAGPPRWK